MTAGAISGVRVGAGHDPDAVGIAALALERLYDSAERWARSGALLARRARARDARGRARAAPPARRASWPTSSIRSIDAAEELECWRQTTPDVADPGCSTCWNRSTRGPSATMTSWRRCSGKPTPTATPVDRLAHPAPAWPPRARRARRARIARPRRSSRSCGSSRATPTRYAALQRIYRGADRPAALAAAMSRRLEVAETIEAQRELLSALAQTYERELDEWEKALDAYSRAERSATCGRRPTPRSARLAERLGRWDVATRRRRRWTAVAPENAAALAAMARVGGTTAIRSRAGDVPRRRRSTRPGQRAGRAADRGGHAPSGRHGAENRQGSNAPDEQAVELYVRALAADPDHASAAERLAEVYARAAAGRRRAAAGHRHRRPRAGSGDTDRLVALQMRLAEACVQLGKTHKKRWTRRSTPWRARTRRGPSRCPCLHKYGDLRMERREWKDALTLYESILRDAAPDPAADRRRRDGDADGVCHTELGNADDAVRGVQGGQGVDPQVPPGDRGAVGGVRGEGDWAAWVRSGGRSGDVAEADESAGARRGDRRRVRG